MEDDRRFKGQEKFLYTMFSIFYTKPVSFKSYICSIGDMGIILFRGKNRGFKFGI